MGILMGIPMGIPMSFSRFSMRRFLPGNAPATRRHRPGKDNLAPAEDVHNKNPSLVALGKKWTGWTQNRCPGFITIGVNGTAVAPHGLILGEDEATPSRTVFKYLPGPPGPVFHPKMVPKTKTKNP